jgi:hypothetical protein
MELVSGMDRMGMVWTTKTWMVLSESKLLSLVAVTLALVEALLDTLLNVLPNNLLKEGVLDLELDLDASDSSCSFLSIQHSETSCPLCLQ